MRRTSRPSTRSRLRSALADTSPDGVRDAVRGVFVAIIAIVILTGMLFIGTLLVRGALTGVYHFTVAAIPWMWRACLRDPWLFLALFIAILLVWTRPWDGLGGGADDDLPRRGSHVKSVERSPRLSRRVSAQHGHVI